MLVLLTTAALAAPVSFIAQDRGWHDVWVDGEKVADLRGLDREATVDLAPGTHRVELRSFMGSAPVDAAWLNVRGPTTLTVDGDRLDVFGASWRLTDAPPPAHDRCFLPPWRRAPGNVPATARVEVVALDWSWADVRIDGRTVAELRGPDASGQVRLRPGWHTLEVRPFMGGPALERGRFQVGCVDELRIGISEDARPVVFNDPLAWRDG